MKSMFDYCSLGSFVDMPPAEVDFLLERAIVDKNETVTTALKSFRSYGVPQLTNWVPFRTFYVISGPRPRPPAESKSLIG